MSHSKHLEYLYRLMTLTTRREMLHVFAVGSWDVHKLNAGLHGQHVLDKEHVLYPAQRDHSK